ncbi:MAG: DUF3857 domain-containing protein [Bacteroidales bacterium]|nr:DUF3857 domain-containing protein [Bacteroidales bacterium]
MRTRKIILVAFLSFILIKSFGFTGKEPIKWGKVSKSEFEINSFRGDSSPPAIILCDYGNIRITNRTMYSHHKRIKINHQEGLKFSRIEIPYNDKESHDDIMVFKANVYQYQNGSIIKMQYHLKDARSISSGNDTKLLVLDLQDVMPGSIIEYYYEIASLDFVKLDDWYFQSEIPTLWSEIRFEVPSPFFYLVTYQRGEFLSEDQQLKYARNLQWLYNANRIKRRVQLSKNDHLLYQSSSGNYKVFVLNDMKKKIVMRNIPGVSDVAGYVTVKDYYPRLRFDLFESSGHLPWFYRPLIMTAIEDYETRSRREWLSSNEKRGYVQYRLDTWSEFNEKLLENERFGRQLIKYLSAGPAFQKIPASDTGSVSKMEAIFKYVQKSFTWNGRYQIYANRDLNRIPENDEASSGEMNLILINLLRRAGFDADPVLIRTSNLGQPETIYPVQHQFNHVIAVVFLNDEMFLLDAITKNKPYHELPDNDLHTTGWRVNKDDFGWIDINPI